MATQTIRMYATAWCGDCFRAKRFFDTHEVTYDYIDINDDPEGARIVEQTNNGSRSVPTIIFPDGSVLVEPSDRELADKLQLTS
ncbi:mycoredoxin [soil metagenome]